MKAKIKTQNGIPVNNLTFGKEYEVIKVVEEGNIYGRLFVIKDDLGRDMEALEKECAYLSGGEWEITED